MRRTWMRAAAAAAGGSGSPSAPSTPTTSEVPRRAKFTSNPAGTTSESLPTPGSANVSWRSTPSGGLNLGIPETSSEFRFLQECNGHRYTVLPALRGRSEVCENVLSSFCGNVNSPTTTIENLERARKRMNGADKREKEKTMHSLTVVYLEHLCRAYTNNEHALERFPTIDHAVAEKMLYPSYLPTHEEVMRAFDLGRRRLWYTPSTYSALENICRLALERADHSHKIDLDFQEWYSLFFNFYQSFHPLAYHCEITQRTVVYTKEFIDELAEYLRQRCLDMGTTNPILDVNAVQGRLAHFLNATGKIPVPVIACHERPLINPYSLSIPMSLRKEFELPKVEKIQRVPALDKYKPDIVLCQDMRANTDWTADFRSVGSVKEYLLLGVPFSYIEGHPWFTWGIHSAKPDDDNSSDAHHRAQGFTGMDLLPHISRYVIHKRDTPLCKNLGQIVSFHKDNFRYSWASRARRFGHRLQTFY